MGRRNPQKIPYSAPEKSFLGITKISCWVLFPVKNEADTAMHSLNCIKQGEIDQNPADGFHKISVAATICRAALRERNEPTPLVENQRDQLACVN